MPGRMIRLDRQSGIPLYIQIKEALKKQLAAAPEDPEAELLPQRELAEELKVSRNTVSMAYAELERDGLVTSRVGKGTQVVSPAKRLESRNLHERLARAIEHAAEEALSMGFTIEQFAEAVDGCIRERRRRLRHIQVAFVECNREQLEYFTEHLELESGVEVEPVLLADIRKDPEGMIKKLCEADLIVTSFFHVEELERMMPGESPPLAGVNLQPEMSTIVKIARIPSEARVGMVAASRRFLAEIRDTLAHMNVNDERLSEYVGDDPQSLKRFVEESDALIVSPSRRREVEALAGDKPVAEFLFAPDKGSVNNIRIALFELKRKKEMGEMEVEV